MHQKRTWIATFATVSLFIGAAQLQSNAPDTPASAKSRYVDKLASIDRDAESRTAEVTRAYIAELADFQEQATRKGDLDEAVSLRDEIRRLKDGVPTPNRASMPARAALASHLARTEWQDNPNLIIRLNPDGSITRTDRIAGNWAVIGDHTVVMACSDGWVGLFQFDDKLSMYRAKNAKLSGGWEGRRVK